MRKRNLLEKKTEKRGRSSYRVDSDRPVLSWGKEGTVKEVMCRQALFTEGKQLDRYRGRW